MVLKIIIRKTAQDGKVTICKYTKYSSVPNAEKIANQLIDEDIHGETKSKSFDVQIIANNEVKRMWNYTPTYDYQAPSDGQN